MNEAHMRKVENPLGERTSELVGPRPRAPLMAWREGATFHLVNLSSLLMIEPEEIVGLPTWE